MIPSLVRSSQMPLVTGAPVQQPGAPNRPAVHAYPPAHHLVPIYPPPSVVGSASAAGISSAAAAPAGLGPPPVLRTRSQQRAWLHQQGFLPLEPGQAFAAGRPAPPSVPSPVCGIFWDYENAPLPAAPDAAIAAARTLSELCRPFGSMQESRVYHDSAKAHSISNPHRTVLSEVCLRGHATCTDPLSRAVRAIRAPCSRKRRRTRQLGDSLTDSSNPLPYPTTVDSWATA